MISKKVIPFIEKYKGLIEEENFDALYSAVEETEIDSAALTEAFLGADIDPMVYFHDTIPYAYAARLPLTTIDIPDGILSVGTCAFSNCPNLISVHLPESLTSIRIEAFSNCSKLIDINLPENISNIGPEAFEFCYELKNIKLPNSLTSIDLGCFIDCENLESVIFGNRLEGIKAQAFSRCVKLASLVFPESLEYISGGAFEDCDSLKELTFLGTIPPKMVKKAFSNCPIETVHFNGSMTTWKNNVKVEAFNLSNQIRVVCRDGEIIKNRGDLNWKVPGDD